jgi:glutamate dehydrogenase/leucine dehydrogenase
MTLKFRIFGIPLGGAKAGIVADPASPEKERHIRAFARLASPLLKEIYIAGEDLGTTARDVNLIYREAGCSWFDMMAKRMGDKIEAQGLSLDELKNLQPTDLQGINLEEMLTGFGLAEVAKEAAAALDLDPTKSRVSIQGFGTVGGTAAQYLAGKGFRVVVVADVEGVIYREDGLPVEELLAARDELGTIDREKLTFEFESLPHEEWLSLEVEVLVPAAVSEAINEGNVEKISPNVKLIIEGANMPTTEEAERELFKRAVVVIPDFIANAGAACGFGMLLTLQVPPEPARVLGELSKRLREVTRNVLKGSFEQGRTPRQVAEELA